MKMTKKGCSYVAVVFTTTFLLLMNLDSSASAVPPKSDRPTEEVVFMSGTKLPGTDAPEWLAARSTVIVEARVAKKEPARWIIGHPVDKPKRDKGDYAWYDFQFDQVKPIWKDKDVPSLDKTIYVRVYNAETPKVTFKWEDEPEFEVGEHYILCLTEMDGLAYLVGPEHWRVTGGAAGAFKVSADQTKRKGEEFGKESPIGASALRNSLLRGVSDEKTVTLQRALRAQFHHKGINLKKDIVQSGGSGNIQP
jgi:hypothetical protein